MLNEKTQDLREQMVIRKALNPNKTISVQSWLIFGFTWLLWLAALFYLMQDYRTMLFSPLFGQWTLWDMIKTVVVVLLVQLNILFIWSSIVAHKGNKIRAQRLTALRIKEAVEEGRHPMPMPKPKRRKSA